MTLHKMYSVLMTFILCSSFTFAGSSDSTTGFSLKWAGWRNFFIESSSPGYQIRGAMGEFLSGVSTGDSNTLLVGTINGLGILTGSLYDMEVPTTMALYQNFPNPFNPVTTIRYSISSPVTVRLKIYDILGNEIRTLVNEYQHSGNYAVQFNAASLSSGIYIYRLEAGKFVSVRKLTLLK